MAERIKPITDTKIPGTEVPDVTRAPADDPHQKRWMSRIAVTTAVLAALASISSMFSTNHLNESMIEQIRASDQWAFFQAKGIKLSVLEGRIEELPALGRPVSEDDRARAERYKHEQEEISAEARSRESSAVKHRRQYASFSKAATAFQVGIALAAVALLVRSTWFWIGSLGVAVVGCAFFANGVWALF